MNQRPFASLIELQQAHDELSRTQSSTGRAAPDASSVAEFIRRAVATGTVLDSREERSVAQSLTNFWAKRLNSKARSPAVAGARPSPLSSDTALATDLPPAGDRPLSDTELAGDSALAAEAARRKADGDLIEDTLLAEYDANTLGESAAAADRVIRNLSDEDAELAQRLVMRLLRLRPEGKTFDAIPTSRAAMQTFGDPAAVDRIIDRLAETGVVRVAPGENPLADRVGLRSVDLRGVWPRLNEWMDARVAFRDRASAPLPERGISRFPDYVVTWLTKQLASVSRFFVRLRRKVSPTSPTEISEHELDDAEQYHDHNARESEYLRRVRDRRRRLNEANRVLIWLATVLFAVAVFGWWLARSKATQATANAERANVERQTADDRLKLSSLRQVCRAWAEVITARSPEQRQIAQQRWNSLVRQEIVKTSLAGYVDLDQIRRSADRAYMQQNAPPAEAAKDPTDRYHARLMEGIENLRNELLDRDTVRPSLETARSVAFDIVRFCINNTNQLLVENNGAYGEAAPFIREFWNQYWGDMILVEGNQVAEAMVNYGDVLNRMRDHAVPPADAAPPTDVAKPPPPSAPPTSKGSDVKASPPTSRPPSAKNGTTSPPPPTASPKSPAPRPVPAPAPAELSPMETQLLDKLKTLPLDQAERYIRMMRERKLPAELRNSLSAAYKRLKDALDAEESRPLVDVLRR